MREIVQQGLSEIKRKIRAIMDSGVCCMPLREGLLAIRAKGGKYLWREDIRWEDPRHPDIGKALATLRARRPEVKRFSLAVNFPSLAVKKLSMPVMTEEELISAMSWEEDRLFPMEAALSWQIIDRDETGFQLLVTAVKKETLTLWREQARAAGMTLIRAFSVTNIKSSEEASLTLYGGETKGFLLFVKGTFRETKRLSLSEGSQAISAFFSRMRERSLFDSCSMRYIPLADADGKEAPWQAMLSESGAEMSHDRPLWQTLASLMEMTLQAGEKHFYEAPLIYGRDSKRPFPIEEGIAAGALALCIAAGFSFIGQYRALSEARDESAHFTPVRSEMALYRKNREEIQELTGLIQRLNQTYGGWEKRLITLADGLPEGTMLTRLQRENDRIMIIGIASDDEGPMELKNRLSRSWHKEGRLTRKRDPLSKLIRFELIFQEAGENT